MARFGLMERIFPERPTLDMLVSHLEQEALRLPATLREAPLAIALSAGGDSAALALAAGALRIRRPDLFPETRLLHVCHGLRGAESRGDLLACRELAARTGLALLVGEALVEPGPGLEARARSQRYLTLRELHPRGLIATAHHLQDQAETVLLRLLRGAGPRGLYGIAPLREDGVWRPFLGCEREDLRSILSEQAWVPREDSSNADTRYARNELRHGLLPAWEAREPGISRALASLARSAWRLRPHLSARLADLETMLSAQASSTGWSLDLARWESDAHDPELGLLVETLWTRTGRRPWSLIHRRRLLEDTLAGRTGTRLGGQGETARYGGKRLAIEAPAVDS